MILFESQPEDHIIESDLPKGCNLSEVWYIDHVHVWRSSTETFFFHIYYYYLFFLKREKAHKRSQS